MNEIKISLSLELQGSTMLSEQECLKDPKKNYDHICIVVNKNKSKKEKETLHIFTRKCKTIRQNIKLSKEAYEHMIASPSMPNLGKVWSSFSIEKRIKLHCKEIAESLGALSFDFEILNE